MMFGDYDLKDAKLYKDDYGRYFLTLTYSGKDECGNIHELVLDGVPLPLYKVSKYVYTTSEPYSYEGYVCNIISNKINVGFGDVDIYYKDTFDYLTVTDKIVEYSVKEMSIEEIEKKLGHKVKIVNKEE